MKLFVFIILRNSSYSFFAKDIIKNEKSKANGEQKNFFKF